jgi:hypothetical protein
LGSGGHVAAAVTAPPYGPLTFADWLRTCRVEVALAGPLAGLTVEAETDPGPAAVVLPGPPYLRAAA